MPFRVDDIRLYRTFRMTSGAVHESAINHRIVLDAVPSSADLHAEVDFRTGTTTQATLTAILMNPEWGVQLRKPLDLLIKPRESGTARINLGSVIFTKTGMYTFIVLLDATPVGGPLRFEVIAPEAA